jgi:hypothetical protein
VFLPWLEEPMLNSRHYEDDVGSLFFATICTATPSHIKSGYVTLIKVQINLPEIHIQKVQNPIVLKVINWI